MHTLRRRRSVALAPVLGLLLLTGCGSDHDGHTGATPAPSGTPSSAPSSNQSPASTTGAAAADVEFAQQMIVHHEGAVEMAEQALDPSTGAGPEVQALATRIRDAQEPEIATMTGWLTAWGAPLTATDDGHGDHEDHGAMSGTMPGMMDAATEKALAQARGAEFDRLFLQAMIAHHEGAITMSRTEIDNGKDPAALDLARSVERSQTAEIEEMRGLLGG
ncbi:DUF305 domain-containing protein [Kineococcus gynurae]|uniref:DUF305 domain-containing protein n=1 Tax=Kineococcus gynurae TaxID=452979 RepID=A0ABV5LP57_9ACTN